MNYGKGLVQAETPVRTGRLRNGWYSRPEAWDAYSLRNDVPYAPFVERRFGMLSRAQPHIERYLSDSLGQHIEQELN